jgi:transcriptional regulator with XRE-family HTH domain
VDGEPPGGGPAEPPAARLRQLRAQRGLSQEQLAHLLGVSFATVNRWETGRTQMSARARRALADFEARDGSAAPVPSPPALAGPTLPVAQSSFIGRDRELGELVGLLERSRLLTLIGPGGAGKTRLAVEALSRAAAAVPVTFVPLETVRQPESLITALAAGVRVPDQAGVPLAESVATALAEVPRLIVLDGAVLAIPGTGNPDHLAANVAAAALRLSPGEMARLEAVS